MELIHPEYLNSDEFTGTDSDYENSPWIIFKTMDLGLENWNWVYTNKMLALVQELAAFGVSQPWHQSMQCKQTDHGFWAEWDPCKVVSFTYIHSFSQQILVLHSPPIPDTLLVEY